MKWQECVEDMINTEKVKEVSIISLEGGVLACTSGFEISAEEQNAILSGFQNGEYYGFQDQDEKREAGLILNHEKYIFKQKEDRLMYLVKPSGGAILMKTGKTVIVAIYLAPTPQEKCVQVVRDYVRYFEHNGF